MLFVGRLERYRVAGTVQAALLGASPTSILGELTWSTRIWPCLLQQAHDGAPDSRAWGPPPGFQIGDGSGVEPESNGKFALRKTEPAANRTDLLGDRASCGSWVHSQERDHKRAVPNRGLIPTQFPPGDGLASDLPTPSEGSLRQAQSESRTADVITQCDEGSRITPWQNTRSPARESQAGKRQRNPVRAAGWATPNEAAAAGRVT